MQGTTEKWVYVTARAPNISGTDTILKNLEIPTSDHGWIKNLRGKNIHNGAAAVIDYRTGEVLAYVGSGSYNSPGNAKFQPQFDVLSDGWRQPGSSIKPINYAIGIEDRTMTAATMFMDVVTDFGRDFTPTQADSLERGPVRVRSALQFSLNIPSIKAGIVNGLDHFYERSQDFGIQYIPGSAPVISMGIGTIELHPIDLLGAYGAIANGGVLMPRTTILSVPDSDGNPVYPDPAIPMPKPRDVISPQAAYIITDILGRQHEHEGEPVLGRVGGLRRRRPPAGRVQDRHDERQPRHARLRLPRPAGGSVAAGLAGRRLDGQQQQRPEHRHAVTRLVGAPLVEDHARGQQRSPDRGLARAVRARGGQGRRVHGHAAGPFTSKTVTELFIKGTAPSESRQLPPSRRDRCSDGPALAGRLRRAEGRPSAPSTSAAPRTSTSGPSTPGLAEAGGAGHRRLGRAGGDADVVLLRERLLPVRRSWGGVFAPSRSAPDPGARAAGHRAVSCSCRRARAISRRGGRTPEPPGNGKTPRP